MKMIIEAPRKRRADPCDLLEFCHARTQHTLQAAEMLEQRTPFRRAQARNALENRLTIPLGAPAAMTGNGETVCFVANSLDQPQRGRVRLERTRCGCTVYEQPLLAGAAIRPFRDPDERQIIEPQVREHPVNLVHLTQPAIDQKQVRRGDLAVSDAGVAPLERLM
jgi:hypothetical protein